MEGTTYPRMNRVFLTGIAQEEPELRYTPSGVSVSSFRVQVGRILRDRSGGAREVAAYLTVVAWQEAAQRMSRELRKGQAVYVEGYVSSRSFTTARGDKRTAIEIYAEQVQILGPFREGEKAEPVAGEEMEEATGSQGAQRRGGFRRELPRSETAHDHPAEPRQGRAAEHAPREAEQEPAAEPSQETGQEASTEPSHGGAEPMGTEPSTAASESEGGTRSWELSEGREPNRSSDETQNP